MMEHHGQSLVQVCAFVRWSICCTSISISMSVSQSVCVHLSVIHVCNFFVVCVCVSVSVSVFLCVCVCVCTCVCPSVCPLSVCLFEGYFSSVVCVQLEYNSDLVWLQL